MKTTLHGLRTGHVEVLRMNDFILSCCSTADLTKEHFEKRDIKYICYTYELDGVVYPDDLGQSMSSEEFYRAMVNGAQTKTSQINAVEYEAYFEPFLKEGRDVLHISMSSGITGSVNSARIARDTLLERYPERKLYIVDSLTISSGYGLLMDKLADLREEGRTIEELRDWAEENKLKVHHRFFSSDLTFYIKGGRVSKTAGFFGTVLNICPVLDVNKDGQLIPRQKIRTKKKAMELLVKQMEQDADNGTEYADKCYMCHSACYEDAKEVADRIEERFPKLKGKVEIYNIGTTIGSHSGPGTVAVFFWGKKREE